MLKPRLQVMQVKCTFDEELGHLREDVDIVTQACSEVCIWNLMRRHRRLIDDNFLPRSSLASGFTSS